MMKVREILKWFAIAIGCIAALITAACHSDSAGEKNWGIAEPIGVSSVSDSSSYFPRAAIDGQGNTFVSWIRLDQNFAYVDVNRFSAIFGWDSPTNLDQRRLNLARAPEIGVSEDGSAIVLLGYYDGTDASALFASQYQEGVGWSEMQTVEETGVQHSYSRPAINSSGVAQAIWTQFDLDDNMLQVINLYSGKFTPGAGWSSSELIENRQDFLGAPQIALDSNGEAIAVWAHRLADGVERIYSNRYTPGDGWGQTQRISSRDDAAYFPRIVVDGQNNVIVVWIQRDDSVEGASLYMNEYKAGSGWTNDLRVAKAGGHIQPPHVVVESDDGISVIWTDLNERQDSSGLTLDILSAHRPAGQDWTVPGYVDVLDGFAQDLDMASDSTGGAIAAWSQDDGSSNKIFVSRFSSDIGWSVPQRIDSDNESNLGTTGPQIAIAGDGGAVVVWVQEESGGTNIYANRFE